MRQLSLKREYAILARGVDRTENFIHFAAPTRLFDSAALALYEEIRTEQTKVLAAGIKSKKALYGEERAF